MIEVLVICLDIFSNSSSFFKKRSVRSLFPFLLICINSKYELVIITTFTARYVP